MRTSADRIPAASHERCALHPSRPAVDHCPVCGRARCRVDAETYGASGCEACRAAVHVRTAPAVREIVVRAALAGVAAALFDGWVETQYVRVHLMSLVAPLVGGLAAGWACMGAAGREGRRLGPLVLVIAAVAGVLGAALAFRLNSGGGLSPLHPPGRVGPPYLATVLGVALSPLLFAGPRRQPPGEADDDDGSAL
jgi:hypothetical protein